MITFEFGGKTYEKEVTWQIASRIHDRVGDPHRILASGGDIGLIQAVRMVSILTGIPEQELGEHAMRKGAKEIYDAAAWILRATVPVEEDAPEIEDEKKD